MLLTNHDLHDLYAVFLILRAYPAEETNEIAVRVIQEIIDMPQTTNCIESNIIRNKLSAIPSLDREKWYLSIRKTFTLGEPPSSRTSKYMLSSRLALLK